MNHLVQHIRMRKLGFYLVITAVLIGGMFVPGNVFGQSSQALLTFEPNDTLDQLSKKIQQNGYNFTVGHNWVYDMTPEQKAKFFSRHLGPISGGQIGPVDIGPLKEDLGKTLPTQFDWRNYNGHSYIGSIRDQGQCGSCYAFGASAAAEGTYNWAMGKYDTNVANFSEAYIAFCLSAYYTGFYGCDGANYDYDELKALVERGTINESVFPYSDTLTSCAVPDVIPTVQFTSWYRIPCGDIAAIKTAIMTYGVVDAAVYVDSAFEAYSSGIYENTNTSCSDTPCYDTTTNHAIALVGWGVDATTGKEYWILRNSWGTSWGESGYMRIEMHSAVVACEVAYLTYGYTLQVNKSGTGTGTVTSNPTGINCGSDCIKTYPTGTVIKLTATVDSNSTFTGWSGGICSGIEPCTLTLNSNTTVTATFTSSTPTPTPTPTQTPTPTPTPTQTPTPTPTPTQTPTPIPTPTPTVTPTPTPTPTSTPTPTPTPTPNMQLAYFAEGYTGGTFTTYFALFNPNTQSAQANLTFMKEDGSTVPYSVTIAANNRRVVDAKTIIPNQGFATKVESTLPIAAERSMYWDAGGFSPAEGHNAVGVPALSTTWYLAEGYNSTNSYAYQTVVMLVNPGAAAASVEVTFVKEDGTSVSYHANMPAHSRKTILTNALIPSGGFATHIISDQPIVAERAMYWNAGGITTKGGHDTMAVTSPATIWYFAEGFTSATFDTYLILMNPNTTVATATLTLMKENGTSVTQTRQIPAKGRQVVIAKQLIPSAGFSTKVVADQPIVAERSIYWTAGGATSAGGHNTVGTSALAKTWYFAEGYNGGANAFDTVFLFLNPNATAAQLTVTFLKENGTSVAVNRTIPANTRLAMLSKNWVPSGGFATKVVSDQPIVAERAMYWSVGGVTNIGGHCSLGLPIQSPLLKGNPLSYPVTVILAGTGTGTVVSPGIDCGSDCTETYAEGTLLNVKAIPEADSTFAGWLVNGEPATGIIPVAGSITITAVFEKK